MKSALLVIKKKNTQIRSTFIPKKQVLEPIFRSHVKGRKGENGKNEYTKLNTSMIKDLEVVLPLTSSGEIDLAKQNQIVKKILK